MSDTGTETLTERVAREVAEHRDGDLDWSCGCGWDSNSDLAGFATHLATAALAVVADDVDGIAGVLRAHVQKYDSSGGYRGVLGGWNVNCTCGEHLVDWGDHKAFTAHQAAMVAAYLRGTDKEATA